MSNSNILKDCPTLMYIFFLLILSNWFIKKKGKKERRKELKATNFEFYNLYYITYVLILKSK